MKSKYSHDNKILVMSLDLSNRNLKMIPYIDPKLGIHTLDLSGNKINLITNLPTGLINLNLSENQIKKVENIPESVKYLDLWENQISAISNLPTGLLYLNLANNQIKKLENLTEKIEYLYIYENHIKLLPTELLKLSNLKEINYYGNPITKVSNILLNKFNKLHRHNLKVNLV